MIPQISENSGSPEVIIITGYGDPESVESALSKGAWDYIEKPFSKNDLVQLLKDALIYHESNVQSGSGIDFEKEGILGQSSQMNKCLSLLSKTFTSDANVLITGETGTGKELFARAIHNNSNRAGNEFVVVDCAALPPNLAESILFGHEKGSYTGADKSQQGLV
jgi:two-component system NtrC family response regulator